MITFGKDSIKKEALTLWAQNFKDSHEYIDYYFNFRYKHENFLSYLKDGKLCCGVHFNPYNISYLNSTFSGRFLVAAATYPQYKDKGMFSTLLNFSFKHFLETGTDLIFLIPANSAIYSKYSFSLSHYLKEYSIPFCQLNSFKVDKEIEIEEVSFENLNSYSSFILKASNNFSSYINKNDENFRNYLEEVKTDGGHSYIVTYKNEVTAAFTYYISEDNIIVKQIFFNSSREFFSILGFLNNFSSYYKEIKIITDSNSEIEYYFPNLKKISIKEKPFIMTRILKGKKMLERYFTYIFNNRFKNSFKSFPIFFLNLKDAEIKENNFTLLISKDESDYNFTYYDDYHIHSEPGISLDIADLTSLIFGATSINALLKRDKITLYNTDSTLLNEVFSIKKGYIHEEV